MSLVKTVSSFFAELTAAQDRGLPAWADGPLVAAVSGGPDSIALLHALAKRDIVPRDKIIVAHLDHQLRPESPADARFVSTLAEEWQLDFRCQERNVVELARSKGMSLEAAARQARYTFLAQVASEVGARAVVTGHNQNDQAETVLMHVLRGSGLTGLRGMRPVSTLPGAPEIELLRPWLEVDRATIEAYCLHNELVYVEDKSNVDTAFFRNRLRHELLPQLSGYNSRIVAMLTNMAAVVAADEDLLAQLTIEAWSEIVEDEGKGRITVDRQRWRALPLALRRRTLRQAVLRLRPELTDIGFETTELARQVAETGQSGKQSTLPGRVTLSVSYGQLVLTAPVAKPDMVTLPQLADGFERPLSVPGHLALPGGWVISVEQLDRVSFATVAANPDPWQAFIQCDFAADLRVRPRRVGERIRPLGMVGRSAKIGDVMTNRKIPVALRDRWPIVAGQDHPLWLVGHMLDERAAIDPASDRALLLRVERRPNADVQTVD